MSVQVVWFKRDLRVTDHAPLVDAAARGPVCALYIVEPGLWALPEQDPAHYAWIRACLEELGRSLEKIGGRLTIRVGPARATLEALHETLAPLGGIGGLWAHQETGLGWTFQRDRAVRAWCRSRGIPFTEHRQDGVFRPHPDRDGWAARWSADMRAPPRPAPVALRDLSTLLPDFPHGTLPLAAPGRPAWAGGPLPAAGESASTSRLSAFLSSPIADYPRALSAPASAAEGCSRLSTHLAWGTLSTRTAVHAIANRRRTAAAEPKILEGLDALEGRLRWRGHFMQKLEDEPEIELTSQHRAVAHLRKTAIPERLAAWAEGRTGWPMVDACMRSLIAHRWLNFRMRALLVSVASYTLWLPWQPVARHLATLFLDFEPGIHYPQVQMQSGTTGIAALRIYDPTRQALDYDPDGSFIRAWVPELRRLPLAALATPWTLGPARARALGFSPGVDYPIPLVDARMANERARRTLEAARGAPEARDQARSLHQRHGSRLPPDQRRW